MQRLSVDSRRLHYKATQGGNRAGDDPVSAEIREATSMPGGLRRNAWTLKEPEEFSSAPDGAVFLRDIVIMTIIR